MSSLMKGCQLGQLLPELNLGAASKLQLQGIAQDSRLVEKGYLFVARNGLAVDGREFVAQAVENGAVAVLFQGEEIAKLQQQYPGVAIVAWSPQQLSLGQIADRFYRLPSKQLRVVGITGTNGKTSSAHFMVQALEQLGVRTGLIGTLGNGFLESLSTASHTTPDAISVHRLLAEMLAQGAEAVVMEVSSHAVDQGRIDAVAFDLIAYTNLTRDHLDYHESMESYAAAKARLFDQFGVPLQLLNLDDSAAAKIATESLAGCRREGFSLQRSAYVSLQSLSQDASGMRLKISLHGASLSLNLPLFGRFNLENLMLVTGALSLLGYPCDAIEQACADLRPVAGRMQLLSSAPAVVVDYAHTPDALEKALQACREHLQQGKLNLLFGCGGDRDRGKRPLMAKVAEVLADNVWVTNDNPRSEDPDAIIQEILTGFDYPDRVSVESDRKCAIETLIAQVDSSDLILLAGKGHESYQEIQGVRYPFSDIDIAQDALARRRVA